ncbi:neuronal acetylcholine receptor subunit alpha-7 [Exaiptasia diaphana]|uniref:Uncharacterized protein n=1 Tax=Exaiptasia diaphana TaxID=2652724 RepID=A0A913WZE5_EXADI|nr:neuronal acetylcholine receptor subunit alpha-7 [Exaiptasia diaphana]KXJ16718.1 Neuronal acetylcholine receptor subunit alpha-7 [Exaiptasia diaphana]
MSFYVNLCFILVVLSSQCLIIGVSAKSSSSNEHKLLNLLFDQYNKAVRPVLNDSLPIDIKFGVQLRKILNVDSKRQELTVSLWVTQVWKNPFLKWGTSVAGGISSVVVDPGDIWIPDIGLMNNADESLSVAGGKQKFKTAVIVDNTGICTWRAPATFKSDCDINVRFWPFDVQKCNMVFSSYTYGNRKLSLNILGQRENKADKFTTSGGWSVENITLRKKVLKNTCCVEPFESLEAEFILKRKPQYFILNFIIPSVVLCFLTLVSFAIPSESGERIGFITTLLLAMTVYLLLIAEVLPETSNQLPITGLLFVLAIIMSGLMLVFTIIILRCYHGTGQPYGWLQRFYYCCCSKKKIEVMPSANGTANGAETPSDIPVAFNQFESKEFDSPTWQDISFFLNRVLFAVSVLMTVITFLAVYLNTFLSTEDI